MTVPTVTAVADKPSYNAGEQVKVQFTVVDGPVSSVGSRTINWTGVDGEGNPVSGSLTVGVSTPVPDTFVLTSVKWADTGAAFVVNGLSATGVA